MADRHPQPASSTGDASSRDNLTLENTYMAATRTLLSLLRTGSAIAGGGPLVTKLLVNGWPSWVAATLSAAFVIVGYSLMWSALKKSRQLRARIESERASRAFFFPLRAVTVITGALQLLIATVVVLFLLRL
jgi:uncharacterized membrane protein YidH (DUF202 family)